MNKSELVMRMSAVSGLTRSESQKALQAFLDITGKALQKNEKVHIVGFGTFEVRERAAREGRNPRTGKKMEVPAKKVPKFSAGKMLKEIVSQ